MSAAKSRLSDMRERAERADRAIEDGAAIGRMLSRAAQSQSDVAPLIAAIDAALAVADEATNEPWDPDTGGFQRTSEDAKRLARQLESAINEALGAS